VVLAQSPHFDAFATEYQAITTRARQIVAEFPPTLRGLAEPLLSNLCESDFSQIVALLPYWVTDLLDELDHPDTTLSTSQVTETLGLANLLGWWSYLIQDWLLDRDLDQPQLLPVGMAFYAAWIRVLESLLPGVEPFWATFESLSLATAEAHCWEQQRHFSTWSDIDDNSLDFDNLDRLADRSALLQLSTVGQFILEGHGENHRRCVAVRKMLHHYAIARQIGDDRTDWADDLQNGRLNYVSARIMRRMKETGAIQSYAELGVERMMGYYLHDEALFADLQCTILEHCQRAGQYIAPYEPLHLGGLVEELAKQMESSYETALSVRRQLQVLFSPLNLTIAV
jgi:hypothetical protein